MIPEIPDRYWKILKVILFAIFTLSIFSMYIEKTDRAQVRLANLQLEMAKKNYCLKPVLGSVELQYQPCDLIVRREQ